MSLIKNITNDLRSFDWNDLRDADTVGIWPAPVKVVITLCVIIGCLAGGYFFHIENLQVRLQEVVSEEESLRIEFERTAFLATNLEEYRAQTVQMEESFTELLRQLPSETEVPGLVEDVTETKTPLLGDLPYIGRMFKRTANASRRTELLIFITPKIITEISVR